MLDLKRFSAAVLLCAATVLSTPPVSWSAECSAPLSETGVPTIKDCIYIARSSISDLPCANCVCDVNGSGDVRITDALRCLFYVIGHDVPLDCPTCDDTTTTTQPACASCNDVLIGAAGVEELCESSQVLYDTMKSCPCDSCQEECGGPSPLCAQTGIDVTHPEDLRSCLRCVVDTCRQSLVDCIED